MNDLAIMNPTEIELFRERVEEVKANLAVYTTPTVVDLFGVSKALAGNVEELNRAARDEILARKDEPDFGRDGKGHRYRRGDSHGVKLERRTGLELTEDALVILEPYLGLFDREVDADVADRLLQDRGVDREAYTRPVVSTKQIEALFKQGRIPTEVAVAVVREKSETWAVKAIESDTVVV
jgi:hypothetical protein